MAAVDLAALHKVQEIDTEIARRERALAELDDGSAAAAGLEELRARSEEAEAAFHSVETELLDAELEMKSVEAKKKQIEDKLYGGRVRNPKELGDLESEARMFKRQIDELTDRILPMMDDIEERRAAAAAGREQVARAEAELAAIREKFEATGSRLREEIAALRRQRAEAASAVEDALLRRYEEVHRHRGDPALVAIDDNVCPCCHIAIPSDTMLALERGSSVQACESCGRIFYWTKRRSDAETADADADEA